MAYHVWKQLDYMRMGTTAVLEFNLDYPTGPAAHCAADPAAEPSFFGTFQDPDCPAVHSADSPLFVAVYCITASAVVLTLAHALHRRQRFQRVTQTASAGSSIDAEAGKPSASAVLVPFGEDMLCLLYTSPSPRDA